MISELNNPWYALAIKILIIPRKRPAGSRDGIVHRATVEEHAHVRVLRTHVHIYDDRRHCAHGIFVHRIYERDSAAKINSHSSVCPAETIFSPPT